IAGWSPQTIRCITTRLIPRSSCSRSCPGRAESGRDRGDLGTVQDGPFPARNGPKSGPLEPTSGSVVNRSGARAPGYSPPYEGGARGVNSRPRSTGWPRRRPPLYPPFVRGDKIATFSVTTYCGSFNGIGSKPGPEAQTDGGCRFTRRIHQAATPRRL